MRGLFLDFEATDKEVTTARPTQVAFSIYDLATRSELYHYSALLFDSNYPPINETAGAITGITTEMLEEFGEPTKKVMIHLIGVLSKVDYLICHNGNKFDVPMLKQEFAKIDLPYTLPKIIDTRTDLPIPPHIETRKLVHLCAEFGFVSLSAHSARHDVDMMARLFFMFPFDEIIKLSESPSQWIRADVNFDNKELAKEAKYKWDSKNKWWVKEIKECHLESEVKKSKFRVIVLKNYDYK